MTRDTVMSTPSEIEQLRNERAHLEEESRNLTGKLQQLETQSKIISEKIAIQELKKGNAAKQEAISQLESEIRLLENQLETLLSGGSLEKECQTQDHEEKEVAVTSEKQEKDEEAITITVLDNKEETIENIGTEH
jgi:hypothetical protein